MANLPADPQLSTRSHRTGTVFIVFGCSALVALAWVIWSHHRATQRQAMGSSDRSTGALDSVQDVQAPPAVARRIEFALDAMARQDAARARDELLEAVEEAPGYAPSYLYLSQAWAALGYRQKALASAQRAASQASSLPPELRLRIEAAIQRNDYEARDAAKILRKLVALRPQAAQYRLDLISADIDAGDTAAAEAALIDLRRLPQASEDPRTELAAAQVAHAQNDSRSQVQHAQDALRLARARESAGLAAEAKAALAEAQMYLGELDSAKSELDESVAEYHRLEIPKGEIAARRLRAAVLEAQAHHPEALEEYQRAIALAETIGDAGDVGAIYRNISRILWIQGDRDGAQASVRRALEVGRATGDLRLQSWTLQALATVASDEAATDEVLSQYREVLGLTESSHDPGGHVWALATYADTLRMRGQLDEAQSSCVKAEAEAEVLSDPQFRIYTDSVCATLAMDRGEQDTARLLLDKLALLSRSSGSTAYEANSEFMTGQIESDAGHYATAQEHLRRALTLYTDAKADTGVANAEALLAVCAQRLHESAERDRAVVHARSLRSAISSRQEIYIVDIALASLGNPDQRSAAVDGLRNLAMDAERRHWVGWSLESRLAEWQLLKGLGNESEASATRATLEKAARSLGFKRILALLESPRQASE